MQIGKNALISAVEGGSVEIVRMLLDLSDLEAATKDGLTALIFAVQQGNMEIGGILLKAGASVKGHTKVGLYSSIDKSVLVVEGWSPCFVSGL